MAFGEEYGWRGYLQSELLKMGRVRGVLLVGVIWGAWHWPLILMGFSYPNYPLLGLLLTVLFTMGFAIVLGTAVLRSGSVLLAAYLHALNDQTTGFIVFLGYKPFNPAFFLWGRYLWHSNPGADHASPPAYPCLARQGQFPGLSLVGRGSGEVKSVSVCLVCLSSIPRSDSVEEKGTCLRPGEHKYGEKKLSCPSLGRANADVPADSLRLLWSPDSSGVPHATNHYYIAGQLSAHSACASVSQSSLRVVSSRFSA
ncbi:CPBP family intramembrane glutamic endopeptidase [Dictyobacter kobayashii]|uniref:CPBP family intramembrane glutamic endopeptidase n=1 Tax=Dictyobacter kobayashii TaxID=2014872 RepID=UPI0035316C21